MMESMRSCAICFCVKRSFRLCFDSSLAELSSLDAVSVDVGVSCFVDRAAADLNVLLVNHFAIEPLLHLTVVQQGEVVRPAAQ